MITLQRTDASDRSFMALVRELDADLVRRDGADHTFYAQFNTLQQIAHAIVAYDASEPVACGAIKAFDENSMEVKRMYTVPAYRGKHIASQVLSELEAWARELGAGRCLLETGKRQPEAIALYLKKGYLLIPNYGQYAGVENSVCFEKKL